MFVVDTNVLLYAAERNFPEHARCRELLEGWRRQSSAWYGTWSILYEFMRVATHPRVFRRPWAASGAWGFVEVLLASPGFDLLIETDRHATVVAETIEELPHLAGNLVHDARTAILMREHGIRRICTRDTGFHRFPFLEVQDPLVS
jgi:toxin-antitoxin system PIN domain toxin